MRYLTILLCAMLLTACANKQQERAVIAGAILGGMLGAATTQPNATHANGNHEQKGSEMHHVNEPSHQEDMQGDDEHDDDDRKHKRKHDKEHNDDEHEKDD